MEMKQKEFNLVFTCKFLDFAQAYTGLSDAEKIFADLSDNDQLWFEDEPDGDNFLTVDNLKSIRDSWVEIRIIDCCRFTNYNWLLNLTVWTPDVNNKYNGRIIACDCVDIEAVLQDIIKRNI